MNKALYFILGLAVGGTASWFITKKIYEHIAEEEIESVKAAFKNRRKEIIPEKKEEAPIKEVYDNPRQAAMDNANKPNIMEYSSRVRKEGYVNYSDKEVDTDDEEQDRVKAHYIPGPYAIAPEHFKEDADIDTVFLTLYSDDILADNRDEIVEDIDGTVGADYKEYFGKYDDNVVWIRNERLNIDYEITKDEGTYEEVSGQKPRHIELI